jgi:hypothetical protein
MAIVPISWVNQILIEDWVGTSDLIMEKFDQKEQTDGIQNIIGKAIQHYLLTHGIT